MYAPGRYLIIKPASWTRMNDSIMTILEVDSNEDIIKYFYSSDDAKIVRERDFCDFNDITIVLTSSLTEELI